jgi:phenylpropionate dioxygenase-like ring-hydroxylating dioxygenase large terminal subunit
MDYDANYQLINDNLTDFTHLSYVHPNSFGTSDEFARRGKRNSTSPHKAYPSGIPRFSFHARCSKFELFDKNR